MEQLKALSVRQPWAHAIAHLGKDIENRNRCNSHRGLTLIHASAGMTVEEYDAAAELIARSCARSGTGRGGRLPGLGRMERGGIVGVAEIVDCVAESDSPWWMGPRGYTLTNMRPLPFIPCKGTVTPLFWTPDEDVQARVRRALAFAA